MSAKQWHTGWLTGHTESIRSLAFSPDGKLLVSSSWDKTVRIWDVGSRKQLRMIPEQPVAVRCLAVSPDGKLLATATSNWKRRNEPGEVKLWDMATCKELPGPPIDPTRFNAVAFSPDGKTLAYSGADCIVRLWDRDDKSIQATMTLSDYSDAYALEFVGQGKFLAIAEYDGTVSLWNVATARRVVIYEGHPKLAYSVVVSPDGSLLATAGGDGSVRIWPTPDADSSVDTVRQWKAQQGTR